MRLQIAGILLTFCFAGCVSGRSDTVVRPEHERLHSEERQLAQQTIEGGAAIFGADPVRLVRLVGVDLFVAVLQGTSELLLLDADLKIVDRLATVPSPRSAIPVGPDGLLVGSTSSPQIQHVRVGAEGFLRASTLSVPSVSAVRSMTTTRDGKSFFVLDDFEEQIVQFQLGADGLPGADPLAIHPVGRGPREIRVSEDVLVVNLVYEQALLVVPVLSGRAVFDRGVRIQHQGPFWSWEVLHREGAIRLIAGGVEDRALDRSQGEFGFVDSFLFDYEIASFNGILADARLKARLNLSALGNVTPKLIREAGGSVWVAGFSTPSLLGFDPEGENLVPRTSLSTLPGVLDLAETRSGLLLASPLLDRIERWDFRGQTADFTRILELHSGSAHVYSPARVGELLFFTTLLTPKNTSRGAMSRFSCEACHFEGDGDGRTHFSGRESIHVTTKTLRGLSQNLPLFSRAGAPNLASMVLAEFEVANQNRHDRFDLDLGTHSWATRGSGHTPVFSAFELRRSFLHFFKSYDHRPHPIRGTRRLDARELKGIRLFKRYCEDCHYAVPTTEGGAVPPSDWPQWLINPDRDLLWGSTHLFKTGVTPYLDPGGTRVPSLRRIWSKSPYFTNGSTASLREVLESFRFGGSERWHRARWKASLKGLSSDEVDQLMALLRRF